MSKKSLGEINPDSSLSLALKATCKQTAEVQGVQTLSAKSNFAAL